ncbi:MAG: hypothetical protein O2856_09610, partial [Planctomycetota bacterium]|nr:hypothetical protein [Planctomycetota bacterium]
MNINNTNGANIIVTSVTAQDSLSLNLSAAADTVNVQSVLAGGKTTIRTGDGANPINVGSTAPGTDGNVNAFAGELVIVGNSSNDTLNVYDNDGGTNTGYLTSNRIYGLGMSGSSATANGINYSTVENLNINLGSGADTFRVQSTSAGTTTTINTGGGANVVDISSADSSIGPESGNVNGIAGKIVLAGQGSNDRLSVYDKDGVALQEGFLTASRIYGLGMPGSTIDAGGVTYQNFESLDVKLGNRPDTFTVLGTSASTTTTTINTGAGTANTINVGGTAATGGNLNSIAGHLVLLAEFGGDTLNVFDQDLALAAGFMTSSRIYGLGMPGATATGKGITYSDASHVFQSLNINLGERADNLTVLSTNAATTTTVNAGGGDDIVNVTSTSSNTTINGDAGADGITIDSSNATLTVNGGSENDTINIHAVSASAVVHTGTGTNTVNVGSASLPAAGNVNAINGLLSVTGGGTDTLNVNDTSDSADNTFLLTTSRLTGLGMAGGDASKGITYNSIESLRIALGGGTNTGNVQSTLSGTTTTISGGTGTNTVNVGSNAPNIGGVVNNIVGRLIVNGLGTNDILNVDDTSDSAANSGILSSSQLTGLGLGQGITYSGLEALNIDLGGGGNTMSVTSTHSSPTTINTGFGSNKVYVGSVIGTARPVANSNVNGIGRHLTINGQTGSNELNIDNSGDTADGSGEFSASSFTHTAMLPGSMITHSGFNTLGLWLGDGNDQLFVDSTPLGSVTTINTGDETVIDNQTNDIINLRGVGGFTTVNGGDGNDVIRVNYDRNGRQTYDNGFIAQEGGVKPELVLHGQNGSDLYEVGLAGFGSSLIRISDPLNGPTDGNPNRLKVYGTPRPDYFLFRPGVIAAVGLDGQGDQTGLAERLNYNSTINDIAVYGGDEVDTFVLDDTNSALTIYGEAGNDMFQIGQIFASPRHIADLPVGSDPTGFDPGLPEADWFRTTLTTQGFLSNGNGTGNPTTIYGGIGNDNFTVYSNKADLYLFGEQDDDNFTVRAFVKVDPNDPKAPFTNINGGQGADFISYTVNAPVNIEGGDGFDTLTVIGTEFGDDFVITERGILGAGLFVRYGGLEKIVVDALEGNDTFFIQSTSEAVAVEVVGGSGSDTFHVGGGNDGQAITVVANDLLGHSGLVVNETTSADARYQGVFAQDIAVNVADNDAAGVVISMVDGPIRVFESLMMAGFAQSMYAVVLTRAPEEAVLVTAVPTLPRRSEARAGGLGVEVNGKRDGVSLVFDRTNWFVPQFITVTAPQDTLAEGPRDYLIQHSVQQGGSADDGGAYDKLSLPTVAANVFDDDAAGVVVLPGVQQAIAAEDGRTGAEYVYSVVLTRAPVATDGDPLLINVTHDTQLQTTPSQLAFSSTNWYMPQAVRVTAASDALDEGFHFSRITHELDSSVSVDDFYGLSLSDMTRGLAAAIRGDDNARFEVIVDAANHRLDVSRVDHGRIDARSLTTAGVSIGGTPVAFVAQDAK